MIFFCATQRTRQSAAIDEAEKDQQASEAEVCPAVCPDSEDTTEVHDTSSAKAEGMQIQCGNGKRDITPAVFNT